MYGHSSQKCKDKENEKPAVCANCSKEAHGNCTNTPSCLHCGESHPATSKTCVRYIFEKEVQAIRALEKVTFKEARRRALERQIRPGESFSSVLRRDKANKPDNQSTEQFNEKPKPPKCDETTSIPAEPKEQRTLQEISKPPDLTPTSEENVLKPAKPRDERISNKDIIKSDSNVPEPSIIEDNTKNKSDSNVPEMSMAEDNNINTDENIKVNKKRERSPEKIPGENSSRKDNFLPTNSNFVTSKNVTLSSRNAPKIKRMDANKL